MATVERDEVTGVDTTGHEWDGIKELNNPLPKWWLYVFYACIAFSVLWWILFPAWPSSTGYTPGLLGSNQRVDLDTRMAEARAAQAVFIERIAAADAAEVAADPELLQFALAGGERHFKDNCAGCHGLGGAGQLHYPTLADDAWIWGGSLDAIQQTIRHGIRNEEDPDARFGMMPAFGADEILSREEIAGVVQYVLALAGQDHDAGLATSGQETFELNCAACHGEDGAGNRDLGAPNLTDAVWLYGNSPEEITAQISRPQHGVMPAWQGRLPEEVITMLTVYVHNLGGGE